EGAFVAIWCEDRVLLVQTSYQRRYTLPGGGKKRHERPLETAIRETHEEVGISLTPEMLIRVDADVDAAVFANKGIALYEAHFDSVPDFRVDGREISSAFFVDLSSPETDNMWPLFTTYIQYKRNHLQARH
ncbi:MAG: NUDIX domain-containing protein, partial [Verrucomicrobia bacterium]|nr:NUDIX domain-containing protein [Verrucomicrobiota bacterium]